MHALRIAAVLAWLTADFGFVSAAPLTPAEELRLAELAFAAAFAERDLERFAGFLHPDAVFAGRDGPLQGKQAVLAVWSRYFEVPSAPFSWAPERVLVNAAGTLGSTTGPVRDPQGRHVGSFASTWQKQRDGSWLVVLDTSPSCPPVPAAVDAKE